MSYIQRASDDSANAECVKIAFHVLATSTPPRAIALLISYLSYKRPLNEGERHGIFMHGKGPEVLYPAVNELSHMGAAAEDGIVAFIGESKDANRIALNNAIYALILIHHGNALAVVQRLHSESSTSTNSDAEKSFRSAAKAASRWCDERWKDKCEDALRSQ